ncbi:SDR family oxidoreductase [Streptomyces reniochalinae]|uniref:SDR family NAD(P)-dependent oxidoreductase n=1 Tax=Streptomyces reniochalinae TaxID=2250578 RepID=A0A367ESV5_9ACTN|nr:SDR family oxidoreductase [Streptomyces reniochalinae]RCG21073.1 SDR family NAD(P)-dependent oxidoreductase [Streptomyces reniochalinae]
MSTYAVTGAASGMGAALAAELGGEGHRVIGVDLADAEVTADLATEDGRRTALRRIGELLPDGALDGFVPFAGLAAATGRPGSLMVSVNHFGAVRLLEGLRPALLRSPRGPAAVLVSSNSATCQPGWPTELAKVCLAGDEDRARALADRSGGVAAYPATKAALAWYVRERAVTHEWAGSGIRLNAVAPGPIDTPMTAAGRTDPLTADGMAAYPVPLGRAGRAAEVTAAVRFLLSPAASFCVGTVLCADGGTEALLRPRHWPTPLDSAAG